MNTARQWLAGSLGGGAALALATSIALAAGSAAPTAKSNRAAAQADAARSLALVHLPPGAVTSTTPPAGDGGLLTRPALPPLSPNLVDDHAWWTVPGSPAGVVSYIWAHMPPTARPEGSPSGTEPLVYAGASFTLAPVARTLSLRTLSVIAVQLTPTITGVRADGAAVWFLPRPPWDRIPPGVRRAVFTARGPTIALRLGPRSAPRTVGGWRARRLAAFINGLEPVQPVGIPPPCAALTLAATKLTFYGSSRHPLARAVTHENGCPAFVLVRVAHRTGPALVDSPGVTLELERLGAIPECAATQLRPSASLPIQPRFGASIDIVFTNTSRAVCRLSGFPRISLLDRHGRPLRTQQRDVEARAVRRAGLRGAVALDPGETTSVSVSFSLCGAQRSGVKIVLPGERHVLTLLLGSRGRPFDPCTRLRVTTSVGATSL